VCAMEGGTGGTRRICDEEVMKMLEDQQQELRISLKGWMDQMEHRQRRYLDDQNEKMDKFLARCTSLSNRAPSPTWSSEQHLPGRPEGTLREGGASQDHQSPTPPSFAWVQNNSPQTATLHSATTKETRKRGTEEEAGKGDESSDSDSKEQRVHPRQMQSMIRLIEDDGDIQVGNPNQKHRSVWADMATASMKQWQWVIQSTSLHDTKIQMGLQEPSKLQRMVHSWQFRGVCSCVIMINAICIGVRTQMALDKELRGGKGLVNTWYIVEVVFSAFFTVELLLRMVAEGKEFIFGEDWKWNLFDSVLVLQSMIDIASSGAGMNLSFARVLRILRFARILRLIRVMRFFQSFRLMVYSILCSMLNLLWVLMLLFFVIYFFAVFFLMAVTEQYKDANADTQLLLNLYYGTLPEAVLTLFASICGGADWLDVMKPIRDLGWLFQLGFVLYIFFMTFGVMNIVIGTFVDQAWEVSQRDRDATIARELDKTKEYATNIRRFFFEADKDRSGMLSWEEFQKHLDDDRVKAYFQTLELDVSQARALFMLFDVDESHEVGIDEFICGCMRLKGTAKSIDVNMLLYENEQIMNKLSNFIHSVDMQLRKIEDAIILTGNLRPAPRDHQNRLGVPFGRALQAARVLRASRRYDSDFTQPDKVDRSFTAP